MVSHIPPDFVVYLQDLELWSGRDAEIRRLLAPSGFGLERAFALSPELEAIPAKASVHVRRGDYLRQGPLLRPVPIAYYEQALEHVAGMQLVVFSDDTSWARRELPVTDAIYVEGNPDWADLILMTRCQQHICANSTFSWWGAFLSGDLEPIYPWMPDVLPDHFRRIYPRSWRRITVEPSM